MRKRNRIVFTPHPKVLRHIDELLRMGIFGRTRADVVNRLVCDGIIRRSGLLNETPRKP